MLEINALRFAHPGQAEPYEFDLEVAPGEILAITGASGSGKSTLLDLIAGFLDPMDGSIRCNGAELTGLPPEQRPVSILFQADNIFDHLTVGKNLGLGLSGPAPRGERGTAISSALADVGLSGLENRRAVNLSGGQKQRVALARTLLRNRPVLLLDEPFTGLDPETAAAMQTLIRNSTDANNWHVIFVSHDLDDVEALADRHLALKNGRLARAFPGKVDTTFPVRKRNHSKT